MVRMLARLFGGPQYSSPGGATSCRVMVSSRGLRVQVVAVQGGGLAAAQRDQPPQCR